MAIIKTLQDLLEDSTRYFLREELCLDDSIKKLTTSANFCDEVYVSAILEVLVELEDMWVIECLENRNFLLEPLHVLDLLLGNLFHCSLLSCHFVLAEGDHTVCSSS
jgi:hypothetical protein